MAPYYLTEVDDELPAYLFMYEQYAMIAQPVSTLQPAKRLSPSDEDFYPTVSIQALMRIFRDPSLAVHHHMAIQAVMFIFKSLGLSCVPYLPKVLPHMLHAIRDCPSNLREALLQQLATLSLLVREHLRPYIADIFDVVEQFWSTRHLATILSLVSKTAVGVPDEFRRFVPRLIRRLLTTLDEIQVADWSSAVAQSTSPGRDHVESEKLVLILRSVSNLKGVLGEYLHILVPAFLKLSDSLASLSTLQSSGLSESFLIELSILVFRTISSLLESQRSPASRLSLVYFGEEKFTSLQSSENGLPSRVVQPLLRILREKPPKSSSVGLAMIETICVCSRLIGGTTWTKLYDKNVRESIIAWRNSFPVSTLNETNSSSTRIDDRLLNCLQLYDEAVEDLLLPSSERVNRMNLHAAFDNGWSEISLLGMSYDNLSDGYEQPVTPPLHASPGPAQRQRVNQGNLQRAWDVSQRASRDDWDEWMRRLSIQLLREAPSPSLRATASLTYAYQPLARELFSAAFACCWKELSEPYRVDLVHALETAFVADVSPEILQQLLNLAEFMEHDPSGGLPIEIPILADLALKCRAYAKALHYREREYKMGGSNSCVESLISINRKLDLQGKLNYVSNLKQVEKLFALRHPFFPHFAEAALGVLKASSLGEALSGRAPEGGELSSKFSKHQAYEMFYSVIWSTEDRPIAKDGPTDLTSKQELWLAKLGSWSEALAVYEEKLRNEPTDFEATLGCMRCLDASGEWRRVIDLFQDYFTAISSPTGFGQLQHDNIAPRSKRKALRMCAHAVRTVACI